MNNFASCAAACFVLATTLAANAQDVSAQDLTCGKNHYILADGDTAAWIATGNLNEARSGHAGVLLSDGRVLVAGGRGIDGSWLRSAELYDPATGAWSLTGNLATPFANIGATLLPSGKVLVVSNDATDGTAQLYDPVTGSWTATGSLNTPRSAFTVTLLDTGKVLVAGGVGSSDETLSSAEIYDPATGTWSYTGELLQGRLLHTATALQDGRVVVVGGWNDDTMQLSISTVELYDPIAGVWSSASDLNDPRAFHTATRLRDGRVLVAGGYQSRPVRIPGSFYGYYRIPVVLNDSELYDPIAATWTSAGDLAEPRESHTATLLSDGEVLVVGGADPVQDASAETYDPAYATWGNAGELGVGRYGHSATLLADGTVLVAGGWFHGADGYIVLGTSELYVGLGTGCQ